MNDYLNSIVARSLGIAEVVQPRLPHLFESSDQVAGNPSDSLPETEIKQSIVRRSGEASEAQPVQVRVPLIAREVETSKDHPATINPPFIASAPPEIIRSGPSSAVDETLPPFNATSKSESISTREVFEHRQTLPLQSAIEATVQSATRRVSELALKEPESISPSVLQPSIPPAVLSSFAITAPVEQPPESIKITIGRVDVRAVMPPAAPPRPAATRPKPALSLESYLKGREQGKR